MDKLSEKRKKLIKTYSFLALFIFIVAIIIILVLRYNIEGEQNLPFEITNIRIVSTAQGNNNIDLENKWNLDIFQKNDFYFYLEKNPDYKKDESISKITFENFKIDKLSDKGTVKIYKPSANSMLYYYTDEYIAENSISYNGALVTNIPSLEISNQGGLIGFCIALKDLGNYISNDDTEIIHNGTLLSKLNLTNEDISMKVSFDIVIETNSNSKFKSSLEFDLPTGNIIEDGLSILEKNNLDDIVFKRF